MRNTKSDWKAIKNEDEVLVVDHRSCFQKFKANIIASGFFFLVLIGLSLTMAYVVKPPDENKTFYQEISISKIEEHLGALQKIADENGGSRSVMTGSNSSFDWITKQLNLCNCVKGEQHFISPSYEEHVPPVLERLDISLQYQLGVDFQGLRYGGNGTYNKEAKVSNVNLGCQESDFSSFTSGDIALILIGNCTVFTKALLAEKFEAAAVIVYNPVSSTQLWNSRVLASPGYEGNYNFVQIPVLATTYSVGTSLIQYAGLLRFRTNTTIYTPTTKNVWCDTKEGNPNSTIVLGAHLDSVAAGPGINDNGSGSATVLALIQQWYASKLQSKNRIRFAWWGAEEEGLLGSKHYVQYLRTNYPTELQNIALALNLDMVGSSNYIPFIGRFADDPSLGIPASARNGTGMITNIFEDFFDDVLSEQYEYINLTAGSDHFSFLEAGIPAGRIHTGAAQIKDMALRDKYGGVANVQADTCYHMSCDTQENINPQALGSMSKAMAHALYQLSQEPDLKEKLRSFPYPTYRTHASYSEESVI